MFHVSHTHVFCVCFFLKKLMFIEVCRKFTFSLIFVEIGSIEQPRQTWQTQIRLLLRKQSDQGLPCLLSVKQFVPSSSDNQQKDNKCLLKIRLL